jgi:5-methylcytosine-specific restriction endonuclease McrA
MAGLKVYLESLSKHRYMLMDEIKTLEGEIKALSRQSSLSWFLDKTLGYLNAAETKRREEISRLTDQIQDRKSRLLSETSKEEVERGKTQNSIEEIENILLPIYDYWPSYPPDWKKRSAEVRVRDGMCKKCRFKIRLSSVKKKGRRDREMHIHHIIPIAKGGNHKIENLILLCERCHKKKHGHGFSEKDSKEKKKPKTSSAYTDKIAKIKQAIENGKLLKFKYRKFKGETTTRTIKPHSIEVDSIKGKNMNVKGFCYLRKEDRAFNISRMKELKVIDEIKQAS